MHDNQKYIIMGFNAFEYVAISAEMRREAPLEGIRLAEETFYRL